MPRTCTVCRHEARDEVDRALVSGESTRSIAGRYGSLSREAIKRHGENHLPETLTKAAEQEDVREALDVVKQLKAINGASLSILREARKEGDPGTALKAVDRIQKQIELQAKLLGELDERPQVNVLVSAEWIELRAVIVGALEPYPEARESIVRALEGAGSGNA